MDVQSEVDALMGILAIYCDFAKKGLLKDSIALPSIQQEAIDQFARANNCEIFWHDEHKCHLWTRLEPEKESPVEATIGSEVFQTGRDEYLLRTQKANEAYHEKIQKAWVEYVNDLTRIDAELNEPEVEDTGGAAVKHKCLRKGGAFRE